MSETIEKVCTTCKKTKPLTEFDKKKNGKGYFAKCNECKLPKSKRPKTTMISEKKIETILDNKPQELPINIEIKSEPIEISTSNIEKDIKNAISNAKQQEIKPEKESPPIIITTNEQPKPQNIPQNISPPLQSIPKPKYPELTPDKRQAYIKRMGIYARILNLSLPTQILETCSADAFYPYYYELADKYTKYCQYSLVEGIFYGLVGFADINHKYIEKWTNDQYTTEGMMELMSQPEIILSNKPAFAELSAQPEVLKYVDNPWIRLAIPLAQSFASVSAALAEKKKLQQIQLNQQQHQDPYKIIQNSQKETQQIPLPTQTQIQQSFSEKSPQKESQQTSQKEPLIIDISSQNNLKK